MIIKLIIITKFISIHHMQHHTVDLIFDPPKKREISLFKIISFTCHQLLSFHCLVPTLCLHPSLSPTLLSCVRVVLDCA